MLAFYLLRLRNKRPEERQSYLDTTVAKRYRDQVRDMWNAEHPEDTLS